MSPLQPLQREGELDALASVLERVQECLQIGLDFLFRRHELVVGLAVAERLGNAVHVPFDCAQSAGQDDAELRQLDQLDRRTAQAGDGLLERRELPDRQQRLPLLLGDARHEPAASLRGPVSAGRSSW